MDRSSFSVPATVGTLTGCGNGSGQVLRGGHDPRLSDPASMSHNDRFIIHTFEV